MDAQNDANTVADADADAKKDGNNSDGNSDSDGNNDFCGCYPILCLPFLLVWMSTLKSIYFCRYRNKKR